MKREKNVTYQIAILAFVFVISTVMVTSTPFQMLSDVNSNFSSNLPFNLANAQESDEDNSRNIQLILKVSEKEKNKLLLHDNFKNLDIEVVFTDGVPFCTLCQIDDCAHTGFAICAKQNLLD